MLNRKLFCVALATLCAAVLSESASAQSGTRGALGGSAARSAPVIQSPAAGSVTRSAPIVQSTPAGSGTRSAVPAPSSGSGTRIFSSEVPPTTYESPAIVSSPVASAPVTSAPIVSSTIPSSTVIGSSYAGSCCGSTQSYSYAPTYSTRRVLRRIYTRRSYTPSYSYYSPAVSSSGCGCGGF